MVWKDTKAFRFIRKNFGSVAFAIVVISLFSGLLLYSSLWPPLAVVESNSMEHSDSNSYFGIIDTGDLVLVQKADSYGQVRTYVDSYVGQNNFGDYGDVIIYRPYGSYAVTPVIHRAIVLLQYNVSSSSFDIPSMANLPIEKWAHDGISDGRWWSLSGDLEIFHVGYKDQTITVDLHFLAGYHHGGLITKGDHNGMVDQFSGSNVCQEPILQSWIMGVAKMEVPWFGLVPLWAGGHFYPYGSGVHANSWTDLFIAITLILGVPIALDLTTTIMKHRGVDIWARPKRALRHLYHILIRR